MDLSLDGAVGQILEKNLPALPIAFGEQSASSIGVLIESKLIKESIVSRYLLSNPLFSETFWGHQRVLRFPGLSATHPSPGMLTLAGIPPDKHILRWVDLKVDESVSYGREAETGSTCSIQGFKGSRRVQVAQSGPTNSME